MHLSRSRPLAVGFSTAIPLPIRITDAIAMAETIGWDPLDFLRVIRDADDLYIERASSRNNKNR